MKINFLRFLPGVFILALLGQVSQASDIKQYSKQFQLAPNISGAMIIVGYVADEKDINKLMDSVVEEAKHTYLLLDANSSLSQVGQVNAAAGKKDGVKVNWQVLDAFKSAQSISKWTGGVFDIVDGKNSYRNIEIDAKNSTIRLMRTNMQVNFQEVMDGLLADYMMRLIQASGMKNALLKVGTVFRGIGNSVNGTWKIEIQENFASSVQHALKLSVINSAIAAISATDNKYRTVKDYRTGKSSNPGCKGVVLVMNTAVFAQGVAQAVYVMGPQEGSKFLDEFIKARGLIVDANGQFIKKGM
ncbi:MAG: FAD:protein FMN transferase [Pseudomonadota bacterium]